MFVINLPSSTSMVYLYVLSTTKFGQKGLQMRARLQLWRTLKQERHGMREDVCHGDALRTDVQKDGRYMSKKSYIKFWGLMVLSKIFLSAKRLLYTTLFTLTSVFNVLMSVLRSRFVPNQQFSSGKQLTFERVCNVIFPFQFGLRKRDFFYGCQGCQLTTTNI